MEKKAFFYFDDVIWLFRDLTHQRPKSIFDHFYLKVFKEAHDKYGLKVQMNVFYRTDYFYGTEEFTLADMTDIYKAEWEAASDWLKFGFHAKQEFPDYPLINISYQDMKIDFEATKKEIYRFAGESSFSSAVCSHWRPISKAGCQALFDGGIRLINSTGGKTWEYNGDSSSLPYGHSFRLLQNRQPETKIFVRKSLDKAIESSLCAYNHLTEEQVEETMCNTKTIIDKEIGVHFKQMMSHGVVINLSTLEEMDEEYKKMVDCEYAGFGGHEQYFYPDYYAFQPDHGSKLLKGCEIMARNGFTFINAEELLQ